MMFRNIIYAILLGIGMAACLSQRDDQTDSEADETSVLPETEATTTDTNTTPDPATFVVQQGRVGNIEIGMPLDSMRNKVPAGYTIADTTLTQEGMQSTAYLLKPKGAAKGLLVEQQCDAACKVWRINIQSSSFKTPKGVGVGSKYGEVQQLYPISTVTLADGGFVAVSSEANMSFILDTSALPQNKLASLTPETVPANTLVKRILIY